MISDNQIKYNLLLAASGSIESNLCIVLESNHCTILAHKATACMLYIQYGYVIDIGGALVLELRIEGD